MLRGCCVAVLLWLVSHSGFATELSLEQLKVKQQKLKSVDFLAMDFVQSKFLPATRGRKARTTKRNGSAQFAKPDRFVWKLETPFKEYKIYDGKDFYDYSPESKSAVKYRPTGPHSYELRQIVDLVMNFDSLLKRYDLANAQQDGDDIKVELKPKNEGELTSIDLRFSEKKAHITFLKMTLTNKAEVSHEFTNAVFTPIKDSEFSIPAGVKVTDSK
jgi:outer membrane lipoprotein-sorting protein